jgi:hypothetical protein
VVLRLCHVRVHHRVFQPKLRCQVHPCRHSCLPGRQGIITANLSLSLQMGTCYLHLGYGNVRDLLKEYGLEKTEVGLGQEYLKREPNGIDRKVWDLEGQRDYTRGDFKGQDFWDWALAKGDQVRPCPCVLLAWSQGCTFLCTQSVICWFSYTTSSPEKPVTIGVNS